MIEVYSEFSGLSFNALKGMILHEAQSHGLKVCEDSDANLRIQTTLGEFGIADVKPGKIRLHVASQEPNQLYALRDSVLEHITHYAPDVVKAITWSDADKTGMIAPNFQFATVLSSARLCATFTRIRMRLSKPQLFSDQAIHFRFLFPQNNTNPPQWPTLAPNGSTKWPQGADALHRPVYTIRKLDEDIATVDIFHHDGGRTWEWSKTVNTGDQVALFGPGGSGVLDTNDVILAADETGFPAMARMIDALPDGHTARALLLTHTGQTDYPMPTPKGTTIAWATPATFQKQIEALLRDRAPAFLWIGSNATQIQKLRHSPTIMAMNTTSKRLAVFWTGSPRSK
ncbi:NADPH-dependent ferric siderophore reductase, contains FAD-binding and SIP domains [Yoonia rosea]|uniref:NADPH-dependent ferric siderophore reductase, contains FAD-binding and SIP domains n=2 Tax=Yoonia rosea TaxID=287098 RepID=A0A1R3WKB4_9RHOB|nr:NADPH-dependent ferric siderophore reductase, contains FAD-binding and SIP domains [Yoonia rosea]